MRRARRIEQVIWAAETGGPNFCAKARRPHLTHICGACHLYYRAILRFTAVQSEDRIDKRFIRTNDRIRVREVRVIDDEGNQLGIMTPFDALKIAREKTLDLVEVSPTAQPPVCRIMDYGKYLYQQEKKEREAKKHQTPDRGQGSEVPHQCG